MAKEKIDVCDVCGELITEAKGGIEISGENIKVTWAGRGSPADDPTTNPFGNSGINAPMNGRVTLTVCNMCISVYLNC